METESKKNSSKKAAAEWLEALIFSFAVIVLLYTFFFRVITVSGHSMERTLNDGDRLIVQCIAYTPRRGDIIVVDSYSKYGEPLVKRVIGVAGDKIDINFDTGDVSVNGNVLQENYLDDKTHRSYDVTFPLTVQEGCVFVLGDNRGVSLDSRSTQIGQIDVRDILGKAIFRIYPFSAFGGIK